MADVIDPAAYKGGLASGKFWADLAATRKVAHREFRDLPEFIEGRAGEMLAADWLMRQHCYVIPSYDYAGQDHNKAPRLQGLWDGYVIPDLDACRSGSRFWAEVKVKSRPNHRWTTNTYEHGINHRLVEHYQTVQVVSGAPCYLFVYEKSSRWLIAQRLDRLSKPRLGREHGDSGPLIANWNRAEFKELELVDEGQFERFLKLAAEVG